MPIDQETAVEEVVAPVEEQISEDSPVDVEEELAEEVAVEEDKTPVEQDFDSIDPAKLPPEIQKFYKGMQGSFTKKMQALQQAMDSLTPHKERLGLVDRAIQGDKEAQDALARIAGKSGNAPVEKFDEEKFYEGVPQDFDSTKGLVKYLDQRFGNYIQQYFQQMLPQVLKEHIEPLTNQSKLQEEQRSLEMIKTQIGTLKARYPDFEAHAEKMVALKKENPGLNLEQAYKLASFKDPTSPKKLVSKPGASIKVAEPKEGEIKTWEDAGKLALQLLRKR